MKKLLLLVVAVLLSVLFVGCGHEFDRKETTGMRIFVDDLGNSVQIPEKPQRVLTLTSGYDTVLLGIIAPERFVAVSGLTKYEGYSLEYKNARLVKKTVFSYPLERIVKLHPDLVIAADYTQKETIDGVRGMGIPVVVIKNSHTVEGTMELVMHLAEAVNEHDKGQALVDDINQKIALMEEKKKLIPPGQERSVLFLSSMAGYSAVGSLFDDMCTYMGIVNAPRKTGYKERTDYTEERILAMDPDFILLPTYQASDVGWRDRYAYNPALAPTAAVKKDQVKSVKAAYLYTSNQYIGEAMLSIMQMVYPELFAKDELLEP